MAQGLWGRLMSFRNTGIHSVAANGGTAGPVPESNGVGWADFRVSRSSPQSFFTGRTAATGVDEMTTNATVDALEAGAIPTAIACVKILQTLKNDLGPDPTKFPVTGPPAVAKALMSMQLQIPGLVNNEWSAVSSTFDTTTNGWLANLAAKQAQLAAPPTPPAS